MSTAVVHVLVPQGIHDTARPSGGNTYDRRLCGALDRAGWRVEVREVGRDALEGALRLLPDGALVVVDGLLASTAPTVMPPACGRLRVVVLMHMPVGAQPGLEMARPGECAVLRGAAAVVTTSAWSRAWLLAAYGLDPALVHVCRPGVYRAAPAPGAWSGAALLCVAAVTPDKGHGSLLEALAGVADLPWRLTCVGSLTVSPEHVAALRHTVDGHRLGARVTFTGPRAGDELEAAYAGADVLVLASRSESYGMVVTEALARAIPVIATDVGGVPEALGRTPAGERPGLLTPPGDVDALAGALRRWLGDSDTRDRLRAAAAERRAGLGTWAETAARVGRVLQGVAA